MAGALRGRRCRYRTSGIVPIQGHERISGQLALRVPAQEAERSWIDRQLPVSRIALVIATTPYEKLPFAARRPIVSAIGACCRGVK